MHIRKNKTEVPDNDRKTTKFKNRILLFQPQTIIKNYKRGKEGRRIPKGFDINKKFFGQVLASVRLTGNL